MSVGGEAAVQRFLRNNPLHPKTVSRYRGGINRLVKWHIDNGNSQFVTASGELDVEAVLGDLAEGFYTFLFAQFGVEVPEDGAGNLSSTELSEDGVGYGSAASYRSALMNALKTHSPRLRLTEAQAEEMGEVFKTIKKLDARRRQAKGLGTGKAPLHREVYRDMSQWFMENNRDATGWARVYLNLTWNLMCKVENTDVLSMADLGWQDDSLTVRIRKRRANQAGNEGDLRRHVFANPLDCVMCPVTALGLYLLTISGQDARLFSHARRQKSLGEYLHAYFESERGQAICSRLGLDPSSFSTASVGKGSPASSVCGSFATPNALGATRERNVELAGGAYIGRLLAGLPVASPDFAVLPPHFDPLNEEVEEVVKSFYGRVLQSHPHLSLALTHCLASIVHHADALRALLPVTHQLNHHELFTNTSLLERLRGLLYNKDKYASPHMQATGVPPHALQLRELRIIQQRQVECHEEALRRFDEASDRFVARMEVLMDPRTLPEGGITPDLMKSMLQDTVNELREMAAPQAPALEQGAAAREPAGSRPPAPELQVYQWGGGFHLVPEDWRLPTNVNIKTGWELWCRGQPVAYRRLSSRDRQRDRQRFNEWKSIFGKMMVFLKAKNAWVEEPTREETQAMFVKCLPFVQKLLPTARRLEELRPSYVCRKFRNVSDSQVGELARTL